MAKKQAEKIRIKVKKIGIRGDEVAILFFSLVSLVFLFISFFRLFAVGKLFDDFIFLFLFGWSKYLAYLTLFIIILPICFNYYFRFKISFILSIFLTLIATSWLVSNINLIILNRQTNIWWQINAYSFKDFSNYFQEWWNNSIINNYHGFFGKPFSFDDWKNVNSFFPSYAGGGVVANLLIAIISYASFVTNFIFTLLVLLIAINWLIFSKPWLFFKSISFLFKPIINIFRKKKIKQISDKSLENKSFLDFQEEYSKVESTLNTTSDIKEVKQETSKKEVSVKPKNKEIVIHKYIQESGNLTPFGKVNQDQTIEIDHEQNDAESN